LGGDHFRPVRRLPHEVGAERTDFGRSPSHERRGINVETAQDLWKLRHVDECVGVVADLHCAAVALCHLIAQQQGTD